jgi:N-methylhydantoinase A
MLLERTADVRYFGQAWEVRVEVPAGTLDRALADTVVDRFHLAHERTYGYSYRGAQPPQQIEWVNLRVTGVGPIERPVLKPLDRLWDDGVERAQLGCRRVYFDDAFLETPIYGRARLQPGDHLTGPAIVEEFGSTSVVFPRMRASVDGFGNLVLERAA